MSILEVHGLCKHYPAFDLQDVSFSLAKGQITGFIGRNGAGKSTTLKALMGFIQPDRGSISFFGLPFSENQQSIKQRIGFVSGGVDCFSNKRLRVISDVTKRFYANWSESAYQKYMKLFMLDDAKTPSQLSAGMRVKYALTLALSHQAQLLLLDEPTSGLDPISRDEVLDILLELNRQGVTILFSTHITSDLERCADRILYLRDGKIQADADLSSFVDSYRQVTLSEFSNDSRLIGCKQTKSGYSALLHTSDAPARGWIVRPASLTDIMIHMEREVVS